MKRELIETTLSGKQGESIQLKYDFLPSPCIAIVECGYFEDCDHILELLASHICTHHKISPLKLIVFSKVEEDWNMVQFSEFYNGLCRVYSKDIIAYSDIQELL